MKKIIFLLALTMLGGKVFAYTFDEEVLEKCGQKHPNDIAGRFVCNNRMQNDVCLKREERAINVKIDDLISIIRKKEISNLNDASDLINSLSDLSNGKLKSKIIDRNDSAKGADGSPLRVLISIIRSECSDDQYYLINVFQNRDRILTGARVWIESAKNDANQNPKSQTRLVNLDWDRSSYEIASIKDKIESERIRTTKTDECKRETQKQYKNLNEMLVKAFPENKTPTEKETANVISKLFSDDNYSVDNVKENPNTNSITILPKCDGIYPEISIIYQFDYSKGKIQTLEGSLFFNKIQQDATKHNYLWKSKEIKEDERIEIDRIEAQKKKEELELKKKRDEATQDREAFVNRVLLILFISLGAALLWFLFEMKNKKKRLDESRSKNISIDDKLIKNQIDSVRSQRASVNQDNDKKTDVVNKTPLSSPQKATLYSGQEKSLIEDFRSKNPFVKIDVPPSLFNQFIQECKWLEEKTKIFPDKENQIAILKSLIK